MLARICGEQSLRGKARGLFMDTIKGSHPSPAHLKVRTARGQHDLVRLQLATLGGQRNVDQGAIVQQGGAHRNEVRLVVVPAQAELLHGHDDAWCFLGSCAAPDPDLNLRRWRLTPTSTATPPPPPSPRPPLSGGTAI